jgi:hypothetical protein
MRNYDGWGMRADFGSLVICSLRDRVVEAFDEQDVLCPSALTSIGTADGLETFAVA